MSKHKKDSDKETSDSHESLVSILSLRQGEIICPSGAVLRNQEVSKLSVEEADWALKSFPEFLKKI